MHDVPATGGPLSAPETERDSVATIALAAAVGLAAGLLAGIVAGEMLGAVHPERVRGVMRRLRRSAAPPPMGPDQAEEAIRQALRSHPATRRVELTVRAIDAGLVELTGIAPDDHTRRLAGAAASGAVAGTVVVNRILVAGRDVPPGASAPATGAS